AEKAGLPCLTLDHQHIITCCRHDLPANMWWDAFLQGITPRWLFRPTEANLIISFYAPSVLPRYNARIAPPILRDRVISASPGDDGHVLVYQSNSTSVKLIEFLKTATRRICYVFGYSRQEGRDGNVVFMPKSEEGFLKLLEGCTYVIQGGSHTLMSEALYLGKPILSLPLGAMIEQRFNALYVERLGYGMQADMSMLEPSLLTAFEERLPDFRETIAKGDFCGNDLVFGLVDAFARTGRLNLA
nr:teichoic acid biosynthesis protein [Desulfovibrio sp.]